MVGWVGAAEDNAVRQAVAPRHRYAPQQNKRQANVLCFWILQNGKFCRDSEPLGLLLPSRPRAHTRGRALIRLTHEASSLGRQLTEAGLGRDGAQEVSHCPAAEPVAWVLESPFLPPSPSSTPLLPYFPGFSEQPFRRQTRLPFPSPHPRRRCPLRFHRSSANL